jgi:hypothetical protein
MPHYHWRAYGNLCDLVFQTADEKMKYTAEQLALFEIDPEDSLAVYGTDQIPFLAVQTTSTHSGDPRAISPIDTDEIAYRIEARRGACGFLSEGVE